MQQEKLYEIGYHITDRIPEDAAGKIVDGIRKVVQDNSGTPVSEGDIEHMALAYPIIRLEGGKNVTYTDSYFGWMRFKATDAEQVPAITKHLKTTSEVLRHLLIEIPEVALEKPVVRRKEKPAEDTDSATETPTKDDAEKKQAEEKKQPVDTKVLDEEIDSLVDEV